MDTRNCKCTCVAIITAVIGDVIEVGGEGGSGNQEKSEHEELEGHNDIA